MISDNDNTSAQGVESLKRLSETLNALSTKTPKTISEIEGARKNFAAAVASFNGAAAPAVAQLTKALPRMSDYGSRWIAAKMLRDIALKDKTQAQDALFSLIDMQTQSKSGDTRYMLAGLIRDIGLTDKMLSIGAAAAIANALRAEKDGYAQGACRNALMGLALAHEAAAPIAVASFSAMLTAEPETLGRVSWSADLARVGTAYASQAASVVAELCKAAQNETQGAAATRYARDISTLALTHGQATAHAVDGLAQALQNASGFDTAGGYAFGLQQIGARHPMPVIVAMETALQKISTENADKRRMCLSTLGGLAVLGSDAAHACGTVLQGALNTEKDAYNRRLVINGLADCALNGAPADKISTALAQHLTTERDRETRALVQKTLRRLGAPVPRENLTPLRL